MEIQAELKYQVFKLIDRTITVQEFEEWLYVQEELVNDLANDLHLTLFSVDYHHRSFEYDFRNKMFGFYDYEEFVLWKVKLNLETIINGADSVEREFILMGFEDLVSEGYSALQLIAHNLYYFEEYMPEYYTDEQLDQKIIKDAKELFYRINSEESLKKDFKLSDLTYSDLSGDTDEGIKLKDEVIEDALSFEKPFDYGKTDFDIRNKEDVRNRWIAVGCTLVLVASILLITD